MSPETKTQPDVETTGTENATEVMPIVKSEEQIKAQHETNMAEIGKMARKGFTLDASGNIEGPRDEAERREHGAGFDK